MKNLKNHPILSLANEFIIDSPAPSNISYIWNFGSLLGVCLIIQILTGVTLAMHFCPSIDLAFTSVEHSTILSIIFISRSSCTINSKTLKIENKYNTFINKSYILNRKNQNIKNLFISYRNFINTSSCSNINTNNISLKKNLSDKEFYEWLRGFTDGEGSFSIVPSSSRKSFTFKFSIYLHKDDTPLLNYIQKRLEIGKVNMGKHFTSFNVSSKAEVIKLIYIFDAYPLNTSKYLNYISWKEGFELYNPKYFTARHNIKDKNLNLYEIIINLKNSMNKKRTNYNLPINHKIYITPYWLLGFIEGEGYFSVAKSFRLEFGLGQTLSEKLIIETLQNFLINLPGDYRLLNKRSNPIQFVQETKAKNEQSNPMVSVRVYLTDYINKVLIPFLDNLTWLSKKELDYLDWKKILIFKIKGLHFTEEGIKLINFIRNRMNRNRLSTNLKNLNSETDIDQQIELLLNGPSNYETHTNGKIFIKSLGIYLKGRGEVQIEVFDENNSLINTFSSIKTCALYFKISERSVLRKLDNGHKILFNNLSYTLKRVILL